jgi:quinohemoprotein ethanol dehydrogenase
LIQAPKNGFLYVIDRLTGRLISAEKYAKVTWATKIDVASGRPVEVPGARFPDGKTFELWPSMFGAHSWHPSAYSPKARLLFIPVIERGATYSDTGITAQNWTRAPGNAVDSALHLGLSGINDPLNGTSWLVAIDPSTQRQAWRVRTPTGADGGLMATAGDLVFQGDTTGDFNAYSSQSGAKLWSFDARSGIVAAPITYLANGTQYVSVVTGVGTGAALAAMSGTNADYRTQPRRVLTFAIGGTATVPPAAKVVLTAPQDATFRADPPTIQLGAIAFGRHCTNCHGFNAVSVGSAPDLRASALLLSPTAFAHVVRDGALLERGMPRFTELDDATLGAIDEYLRSRAADLRAGK